jgi:hypothetical protein
LQVTIQPDEQSEDEETQLEQLVELLQGPPPNHFIGPIITREKRESFERKGTFIRYRHLEEQVEGFIGPLNINYLIQRQHTFHLCDLIISEPKNIVWAEASITTRRLFEDWWEACERLIKEIVQLPFNYQQVPVIRELELKLTEVFYFFDKRKRLEAREAQVVSRTRSGRRC